MKVTTVKKYTGTYFLVSVMPRNPKTSTPDQRLNACRRNIDLQAHDAFVKETNRYRSIPTPRYVDCKITLTNENYEVKNDIVALDATAIVEWTHEK